MGARTRWIEQIGGFASGALSKRLWYNRTSPRYQTSADELHNMMPVPSGSAQRRLPTLFFEELANPGINEARIIPWRLSTGGELAVLITEHTIQVVTEESEGTTQIVKNPETDDGLTHWEPEPGETLLRAEDLGGDNFILGYRPLGSSAGPAGIKQRIDLSGTPATLDMSLVLQSFLNAGSGLADHELRIQVLHVGGSALYDVTLNVSADKQGKIRHAVQIAANVTGQIDLIVQTIDPQNGSSQRDIRLFSARIFQPIAGGARPSAPSPWTDAQLPEIQYIQNPYENQLVLVHEDVAPQEITLTGSTWAFQAIDFTDPDPTWVQGFPRACGAYQGRLVLAASTGRPQTVWASKPGAWRDFTADTTPDPGDGLEFTLAEASAIMWVAGHKTLLVGTAEAEWSVGADSGLLQPGDIDARRQSGDGSKLVQPAHAGHQLFFSKPRGQRLHSVDLQRDNAGWITENHSWWADELVSGIRRIVYCRDPWPHLFIVQDSGKAICLYYSSLDGQAAIQGWATYEIGTAHIVDAATIRNDSQDILVLLVRRDDGTGAKPIHVFTVSHPAQARENYGSSAFYADGIASAVFPSPVTQVTVYGGDAYDSVPHIVENAEGIIEGPLFPENGVLTMQNASTGFTAGLPITSRVKTLPLRQFAADTGHGAFRVFSKLGVRLLSSSTPVINGEGGGDTVVDGPRLVEVNALGHDTEGQITVEQDGPKALTVVTAYGRVTTGDT